jgi:hypothetical protein
MKNENASASAQDTVEPRYLLGLSGGKDSAALALYMQDKYPEIHDKIEYFFSDTGAELKECYEYLQRLEAYLGKEIVRLSSERNFEHWMLMNNTLLPSPQIRWCTKYMKIKPFEKFVGQDTVVSYVGIRADENRQGYLSQKPNIKTVFPFIEDGLVREDIFQILEDSIGIPEYYEWRSRSGCFFCFFQRQDEWLGLSERHPELYEEAKKIEQSVRTKWDWKDGETEAGRVGYTWNSQGSLDEIVERAKLKRDQEGVITTDRAPLRWQEEFKRSPEDEDDEGCTICTV